LQILTGGFICVLLPILYVALPNPILFRWYWNNSTDAALPSDVEYRAAVLHALLAQGMLATILWQLSRHTLPSMEMGLHVSRLAVGIGIAAGSGWLLFCALVLTTLRPTREVLAKHRAVRWPWQFWMSLSVSSAIVEEVWRAFCLLALSQLGHGAVVCVTAIAFGMAHIRPTARAIFATAFGIFAAWLFLATRSVWPNIVAHGIVNVGLFFLIRLAAQSD
jgi:membrane protease YdiL (CAAX protease family)